MAGKPVVYVPYLGSLERGAVKDCLLHVFEVARENNAGISAFSVHYQQFTDSLKNRFGIFVNQNAIYRDDKYGEIYIPAEAVAKLERLFKKMVSHKAKKKKQAFSDFGELLLELLNEVEENE
jgi:hypothetical protein